MDITQQELKTMKAKQLRRLIREAINEVLAEDAAADKAAQDAKKAAIDKEIIALQKTKAELSKETSPLAETDLDEMARIAKGFRLADPNFDATPYADSRVSGVSMEDIINYFRENPGAEKAQLQAEFGFVRPQITNAVVNGLVDAGVLVKLGAGGEVELAAAPGEEEEEETVSGPEAFLIGKGDLDKYFSAASNDDEGNEEDFNAEEEPTAGEIGGQPVSTSSMSDEDYEAFMKYSDLKQRLDATKSNIRAKRSKGVTAGDIKDVPSSDIERLQALKKSLEDKISALVAGSDYLKKKTGQEITAPEIEDIEDEEETIAEAMDEYTLRKLQYYAGIRK